MVPGPPSPARVRTLFAVWLVAVIVGLALVVYGFGPFFQEREQRSRLRDYRGEISRSANAGSGLPGVADGPKTPEAGANVGILEIGDLRLQQIVVEGVSPEQTRIGPAHVPGTAGLGQPGNAVVVGRRSGFGAPFSGLGNVDKGDDIVVTTTQGQTVYEVTSTRTATLTSSLSRRGVEQRNPRPRVGRQPRRSIDDVYGPSEGDQLTLITSASRLPWNDGKATIVVAKMTTEPFTPTLQGGRTERGTGARADAAAKAPALLALLAWGAVIGGAVLLYRRLPKRVAYLLTVGPILAMTIIAGETFSRLFPAWM